MEQVNCLLKLQSGEKLTVECTRCKDIIYFCCDGFECYMSLDSYSEDYLNMVWRFCKKLSEHETSFEYMIPFLSDEHFGKGQILIMPNPEIVCLYVPDEFFSSYVLILNSDLERLFNDLISYFDKKDMKTRLGNYGKDYPVSELIIKERFTI